MKQPPNIGNILLRALGLPLLIILGVLSALGSGGGDSYVDEDPNIGWVKISSSYIRLVDGQPHANLSGSAFVNASYSAHKCAGLCCLLCIYDDSYPGVDVSWLNQTTGVSGIATSRYGTATSWEHLWYASVPLVLGINQLQVTAADPAGNSASANISIEYLPPAPIDLRADTGDGQITLLWTPVQGATAYRLYWSTTPDYAFPYGATIDITNPPYIHDSLVNGATYYYVITSLYLTSESEPSEEIAAIPGIPPRPTNFSANLISYDVELSWDAVPMADTYTLYWANESGVTKQNGTPITGAISPFLHTGLSGIPYYYVVTASNVYGESLESDEVMAYPPLPPPIPTGLSAVQRPNITGQQVIDLAWDSVPGIDNYEVFRCWVGYVSMSGPEYCQSIPWDCSDPWERLGTPTEPVFQDWTVYSGYGSTYAVYKYYLTARNTFGVSLPSDWIRMCVAEP